MSAHLSFTEAIIVGAFQGVTEVFPVSSLGHSVLVPVLVEGPWAQDLNVSTPESPYLAFIVGLHVATAAALLVFFWRDWIRILAGFVSSLRYRRVQTHAERLAWLIVLATISAGLSGLALEHLFRTTLGKPIPAAAFLMINGVALYAGEVLRRRAAPVAAPVTSNPSIPAHSGRSDQATGMIEIDDSALGYFTCIRYGWNYGTNLQYAKPMKRVVPATHRQITATGLSRRGIREPRHGWPTGLGTKHAFTNSSQFGWVQKMVGAAPQPASRGY